MTSLGGRDAALQRLSERTAPFDLLVVGGGITGAGIALDAAARGLSVALVERADFAAGTSSKSSKLVHGGLRYIEQREFGLMREASVERDLLRRLAPHLVEPIPFVLPVSSRWNRALFGVGLWTYDALASFKNLKVHRHLDGEETEGYVPALPRGKVRGGYLFYDCKTDDVRLVFAVLGQARRYGAVVANYAAVESLDGSESGCRAAVRDGVSGATFEIAARQVVVAAGVWADRLEQMSRADATPRLRPSKGIHLVFRRESLPVADAAAFVPDADRKRMLFVIPWHDAVLVGTTDTAYEGDLDRPRVEEEDRDYCLDAVNATFDVSLTSDDVAGAYAGLRPLVASRAGATADLSRRHAVYSIAPGITGITGGKLTTWRRMAKDAVDGVAAVLGARGKCRTQWIRLGSSDVPRLRAAVGRRAARVGIAPARVDNLVRFYGDDALAVLDVAERDGLVEPLVDEALPLAAEATYCVEHEMVVHLDDLLARRTRLALTDPEAGIGRGSRAGELVAAALGWDGTRTDEEIGRHRDLVERERGIPLHAHPLRPSGGSARLGAG
ncbi:MAG TPA: glycerol-3-phosphate dehydrogenase/oxidase [Actinomycetota bacterium]|nr:glycerol-3-phosphate dehydrogenase/oxidase [Actinomycetota bacterium]